MKNFCCILLLFLFCSFVEGQDVSQNQKYAHQLKLIDSVRNYIQNDLHLNIGDDFYRKWSTKKDSMYYCLYVSKADHIEPAEKNAFGFTGYTRENSANEAAADWNSKGYQTMVYKTSGTADAELTPKLLSYPDEAIAFILVHEAVHRHLISMKLTNPRYPYDYEECLCDAVANKACMVMAKTSGILDLQSVTHQKETFEKAFAFLNEQRGKLDTANQKEQADIFQKSTAYIKALMEKGTQFQKDRMIFEVNNAYFLRIQSYALHYFEVQKLLDKELDISTVILNIYKTTRLH